MWLQKNGVWGQYTWFCLETGAEPMKQGYPVTGRYVAPDKYCHFYEAPDGSQHEMVLQNLETLEIVDFAAEMAASDVNS